VCFSAFPHVQEWILEDSDRLAIFKTKTLVVPVPNILSPYPLDSSEAVSLTEMKDVDFHTDTETLLNQTTAQVRELNAIRQERDNLFGVDSGASEERN
jgi:hypothetical protein